MPICTIDEVKQSARVDGDEFDPEIPRLIAAAQSMIEHECGAAAGAFDVAPDDGAKSCAVALCVIGIDDPSMPREKTHPILRSALLDKARSWA
jgi:hypothetical protein